MARYYLHLRDDIDETLDPDGVEFADLDRLRAFVLNNARDFIAAEACTGTIDLGYRINAENEGGEIVYALPFTEAVTINRFGEYDEANVCAW